MKQYDRQSKKWVSEEEMDILRKKREGCKGGKEHDYVEVLPYGVEATEDYKGSTDPYYNTEKSIEDFTEQAYKELEKHGIIVKHRKNIFKDTWRRYMCSVCKKTIMKELQTKSNGV